jgi:hypothetical protein
LKKILLFATSLLVLTADLANACSCLQTTPKQSLGRSSAVFSGKVLDVDIVEDNSPRDPLSSYFNPEVRVKFAVSEVWKGKTEQQLVVVTSGSSASCGYSFQKGQEYLVYASDQEAKLQTGLCSGTKPLADAKEDLAVLGKGETPTSQSSNTVQWQQNRRVWRNQNISSYRYTLRLACNCLPEATQPVIIEVRNGKVTSMVAANSGKPINPVYFKQYNSIPKLFNVVKSAIAKKPHRLSVTYHPTLGYPTQISIDSSAQIADDETFLTLENLEVIK